jgi:ribonuclease P protein component
MNRKFRLTSPKDFKRVRRTGTSYAHPLVVLLASPNTIQRSRFGVTTSRALKKAVDRNRAKRLLREALRRRLPQVRPGWDVVLIARAELPHKPWREVEQAVDDLLTRADLTTNVEEPRD